MPTSTPRIRPTTSRPSNWSVPASGRRPNFVEAVLSRPRSYRRRVSPRLVIYAAKLGMSALEMRTDGRQRERPSRHPISSKSLRDRNSCRLQRKIRALERLHCGESGYHRDHPIGSKTECFPCPLETKNSHGPKKFHSSFRRCRIGRRTSFQGLRHHGCENATRRADWSGMVRQVRPAAIDERRTGRSGFPL